MDAMQTPVQTQVSAADSEADDQGGTSIELMIKADGSMSVSLEANDDESAESQETPARDLNDALRIIKQIAEGILNGVQAPEVTQERAAFEKEMAE